MKRRILRIYSIIVNFRKLREICHDKKVAYSPFIVSSSIILRCPFVLIRWLSYHSRIVYVSNSL